MPVSTGHPPVGDILCDNVLRKVLSWLEVPDLLGRAALVCQGWADASACKEVWRRRMHTELLQLYSSSSDGSSVLQQLSPSLTAAQLFHLVYRNNLLRNGMFLERNNTSRSASGATGYAWAPTVNRKGLTWEYPLTEHLLEPLPLPGARPFSTGCVAASGDWAELVQAVDLSQALTAAGVPACYSEHVLQVDIPLTFSCWAHGSSKAPAEYQLVLIVLSDLDKDTLNAEQLLSLPQGVVPFGQPPAEGPGAEAVAAAHLKGLGLVHSRVMVEGPVVMGTDGWKQLKIRLPRPLCGQAAGVVVALRGRSQWRLSNQAMRFAAVNLGFTPLDA